MMNQDTIEKMIKDILKDMNNGTTSSTTSQPTTNSYSSSQPLSATRADYPIAQKHPEWLKTASGKNFNEINLDSVLSGQVQANDLRITPQILKAQGDIAADAGRPTITRNFTRAAELIAVPDARILEIYNALRPYRSSKQELLDIANELETVYNAKITANYIREAANLYEIRKKLKGDN